MLPRLISIAAANDRNVHLRRAVGKILCDPDTALGTKAALYKWIVSDWGNIIPHGADNLQAKLKVGRSALEAFRIKK